MLKAAPASDDPGGLFHARESLMLGWIALALILWLVAAIRTAAGPCLAARGAAVPSLDAASPRPAPAIGIGARRHPETAAPPGRRPDLACPEFIFGITGSGRWPVRQPKQWRRQAGARPAWRPEAGNDAPRALSADSRAAAAHLPRRGRKSAWDASIALDQAFVSAGLK